MTEQTTPSHRTDARADTGRRNCLPLSGAGIAALGATALLSNYDAKAQTMSTSWDKTFPQNPTVAHSKITFINRYGITLSGDLYQPTNRGDAVMIA